MNIVAEMIIRDYLLKQPYPNKLMKKDQFERLSNTRWATYEILRLIIINPAIPAKELIVDFVDKMKAFKQESNKSAYIFSAAIDVGNDLLEIFYAMQ